MKNQSFFAISWTIQITSELFFQTPIIYTPYSIKSSALVLWISD